ncbi:MAG: hypothetical protein L0Y73_07970 [Candidatus Aminicenantes bacterium]|nr:hypothetical protein [Candidatus Aminicenantes bacterium]
MKKWYIVIITIAVFYILAAIKKIQKNHGPRGKGIFKRIDTFITFVFWFLLIVYGVTFIYWLCKAIFKI